MKLRKKRLIIAALLCLSLGSSVYGCSSQTKGVFSAELKNNELFRINDSVCTLAEAKIYLTNLQDQYESVYDSNMWDEECGDITIEDYVKKTVVSQLAQIKSMALFAKEHEVELTEDEINTINKAAKEYYGSLNEDEIKYMGITESDVAAAYSDYMLANKIYSSLTNETDTEVSDDEARVIKIQQIVINKFTIDSSGEQEEKTDEEKEEAKSAAYEKAKSVLEKAQNGDDFPTLADNYSDIENCEISLGRGEISENLEKVIFDMENDEISDIIETEESYYIVKCLNSYDMEATDANKAVIIEQRKTKAFDEVYEVFVNSLDSCFNEELWSTVTFEKNENIKTSDFFDVYNRYFEE